MAKEIANGYVKEFQGSIEDAAKHWDLGTEVNLTQSPLKVKTLDSSWIAQCAD